MIIIKLLIPLCTAVLFLILFILTFIKLEKLLGTPSNVEMIGNEHFGLRQLLFDNKWFERNCKISNWLIRDRVYQLLFRMRMIIFLQALNGVVVFIILVLLLIKNTSLSMAVSTNGRIILIPFYAFVFIVFYFLRLLEILNFRNLSYRMESKISFYFRNFDKVTLMHLIRFTVFGVSVAIMNIILLIIFTAIFEIGNSKGLMVVTMLLSIIIYQYLTGHLLVVIFNKFKIFSGISPLISLQAQRNSTYIYLSIFYLSCSFLNLNGYEDVVKVLKIPIESITIFFMIDVYFQNKANVNINKNNSVN